MNDEAGRTEWNGKGSKDEEKKEEVKDDEELKEEWEGNSGGSDADPLPARRFWKGQSCGTELQEARRLSFGFQA